VALRVVVYEVSSVPPGKLVVEIVSGGGALIFNTKACAAEVTPAASVTVTEKFAVPVAFGVPEITPVDAPSLAQVGSVPLDTAHVYAPVPPVAASVVEYAVPSVPAGTLVVVTCGAGSTVTPTCAVTVVLATDVAVMVAEAGEETLDGAS
jgi:hypothetical protein